MNKKERTKLLNFYLGEARSELIGGPKDEATRYLSETAFISRYITEHMILYRESPEERERVREITE